MPRTVCSTYKHSISIEEGRYKRKQSKEIVQQQWGCEHVTISMGRFFEEVALEPECWDQVTNYSMCGDFKKGWVWHVQTTKRTMQVDHGEKSRQVFDRPGAILFIAQAPTIDARKKCPHILCLSDCGTEWKNTRWKYGKKDKHMEREFFQLINNLVHSEKLVLLKKNRSLSLKMVGKVMEVDRSYIIWAVRKINWILSSWQWWAFRAFEQKGDMIWFTYVKNCFHSLDNMGMLHK